MNRAKRYAGVFVLLALMCAASCALAVQISVRRADGVGSSVNMWERSSNKKYLFLPAYPRKSR